MSLSNSRFEGDFDAVSLIKCIDGDTARFNVDGVNEIVRFIGIDAPEIDSNQDFAIEAKEFVCDRLMVAETIYLVYDPESDKRDKFDRLIAWVYTEDPNPLQFEIVENGLARVRYIYGDYYFVDDLNDIQEKAKDRKMGIWR